MFFQKDIFISLSYLSKKLILAHLIFVLILTVSPAFAVTEQLAEQVRVEGNQRIETETILTYMGVDDVSYLTPQQENDIIKRLFTSGLFTDVNLQYERGILVITVQENPVINRVTFEGTDKVDEETLAREIQSQPRTVYTRAKLQADTERILTLYKQLGRFSATVNPRVVELDQNRVDIVFEIQEGQKTTITNIIFVGNNHYSASRLKDEIRTTESAWWRCLSKTDTVDYDRFEVDKELLRRFYHSHGYADFDVKSVDAVLRPDGEGFDVTYTLFEGEKYQFGDITLENQIRDLPTEDLQCEITIVKGETYDGSALEEIVQSLTNKATKEGFAFVDIKLDVRRHPESRTADVTFIVEEGARVYIERIDIVGNVRTKDEVIRRELALAEGDPFNSVRLRRSERRVRGLDYFKRVDVKVQRGSAPDRAIIVVDIEEKSTGALDFGAGYSTQDGPLVNVKLTERNLLGTGRIVNLQSFISQRRMDIDFGLTEPYFLNRRLAATIGGFYKTVDREEESDFKKQTLGGNVSFGFRYNERLSQVFGYLYQQDDIFSVKSGASLLLQQQLGVTDRSILSQTLMYNKLDNLISPRDGSYAKWTIEGAGLGGDVKFLRNTGKTGYYVPILDEVIGSIKVEGGIIDGLGQDVLVNDNFFVGGPASLRGFRRGSIGPRDLRTGNFLGGKQFFTGTAEITFPLGLPEELGVRGIVFSDFGTLRKIDNTTAALIIDPTVVRSSVGGGLQWRSPVGPLEIGAALPTSKADTDVTEEFYVNFGVRF